MENVRMMASENEVTNQRGNEVEEPGQRHRDQHDHENESDEKVVLRIPESLHCHRRMGKDLSLFHCSLLLWGFPSCQALGQEP